MELGGEIMKRFDDLNTAENDEILWSDGRHRGYINLTINHQSAHADYVTISNVQSLIYNINVLHSVDIVNNKGILSYE
jgi:alkaline phosphatase D